MKQLNFSNIRVNECDDYIEKELINIKNDVEFYKELKKIGSEDNPLTNKLVKDNISKIIDLREDIQYCKNCKGIENCKKEYPAVQLKLVIANGGLERKYDPCERVMQRSYFKSKFIFKDFDDSWENNSVRTMDQDSNRILAFKRFVSISKGEGTGLFLYGGYGVGKSYVTSCFVNEYISTRDDVTVAFINCSDRLKQLKDLDSSYKENDKETFQNIMDSLCKSSLLVLDGLGNEIKYDYIRDRVLLPLLSERLRKKLPTIITSNYTMEEIATMYSTSFGKNMHPSAKRLLELFKAMCLKEFELASKLY